MPWIVSARLVSSYAFNCFRCGTESRYHRCYTDKCTLTPTVHRYCQRCYYFYYKRADDNCPGCAPRLWMKQARRDHQASPSQV